MMYNIYYGLRTNVKYRFSKNFRSEQDAVEFSKNLATSFYYKNEGKHGLPGYNQIQKESELTGVSITKLYDEYVADSCRWYAIPTEVDSIPSYKIK